MKDDGAQRILKSAKLLWDVQPKAIEGTTPRADPNNNRPLRGDLQLSAISSVAKDVYPSVVGCQWGARLYRGC